MVSLFPIDGCTETSSSYFTSFKNYLSLKMQGAVMHFKFEVTCMLTGRRYVIRFKRSLCHYLIDDFESVSFPF